MLIRWATAWRRRRPLLPAAQLLAARLLAALMLLLLPVAALACSSPAAIPDEAELSLEEAVGQMLMVGFRGERLDGAARQLLQDLGPGGVVLYDRDGPSGGELPRNISSPEQLRALTAELQETAAIPYFIAIDAEGGLVNRLKAKYGFALSVPSAQELGGATPDDTAAAAETLAQTMAGLGLNWNFAPVVDVNIDPESPAIGALRRSFGAEPPLVAAHAGAFAEAHHRHGIATALKHFPGHGSAAGDTHLGVTDVTTTYRRQPELAPYRQLIADGYADPIMTAHIVNRKLDAAGRPATLSPAIMTGLLRDELGFEGVVISDDLQMGAIVAEYGLPEAAVAAVGAGVDIVLLAQQAGEYDPDNLYRVRDAILQAVAAGTLPEARIYESAARILALKRKYGVGPD